MTHPERSERRRRGFTLVEIMAVVLIIGMLGALIGTFVAQRIDQARVTSTQLQIKQLEAALDFYRMDNGRYPTTEQGLDALVHEPSIEPIPRGYRPEGYLKGGRLPRDAWKNPFGYLAPGERNASYFDLWSQGADGQPGGDGVDADIGNWGEDEEPGTS
jgi:general secretion pathway protein G